MTDPKALAEKIYEIQASTDYMHDPLGGIMKIESLLAEALDDAEIEWLKNWNPVVEEDIAKAVAEAYDRAAEVAENAKALPMEDGNDTCYCVEYELTPSMIAERIRALKGDCDERD